jgi:hypothetical protein
LWTEERAAVRIPSLVGLALEEILRHDFPARRVLLRRGDDAFLRAGNIAQIFAYRGIGKTWFLETLALVAATGVEALGLRAPEPCHVLYIDGEMAGDDVKARLALLCEILEVPLKYGPGAVRRLTLLGADWQDEYLPRLDTREGQLAVEKFVEPAELVFLDNRSSLFDPEGEKDPAAWQPAQDWLLGLRRRGKAIVMAHHANRQGGARGIGKAEDVIDLNLKLSRPDDYQPSEGARFLVEFDKSRGLHGAAVSSFEAVLSETTGWSIKAAGSGEVDIRQRIRDALQVATALGEPIKSANGFCTRLGGNRAKVLEAVAAMLGAAEIAKVDGAFRLAGPKRTSLA